MFEEHKMHSYTVFRIIDNDTNEVVNAMIGAGTNRTQCDFNSVEEAREFNCHGLFKDKRKYRIAEYQIIERIMSSDCDPITEDEQLIIDREDKEDKKIDELAKKIYIQKLCGRKKEPHFIHNALWTKSLVEAIQQVKKEELENLVIELNKLINKQ